MGWSGPTSGGGWMHPSVRKVINPAWPEDDVGIVIPRHIANKIMIPMIIAGVTRLTTHA
jgi:hypothetical protein